MAHYLMKYKGIYRILPELDLDTNDFPRDADGSIADSCGLYIKCQFGNKIYDYGCDGHKEMQLGAYIPSRARGRNIKKEMDKQGISYYNYDETDEEASFVFSSNDIDAVAKLLKASTNGKNISPFSSKNLPQTKVDIPSDKLAKFKEITGRLNRGDMLVIKNINSSFMHEILGKKLREKGKRKLFDYASDQKKLRLTRDIKAYIYVKGLFDEYLEYLSNKVNEYLKSKDK